MASWSPRQPTRQVRRVAMDRCEICGAQGSFRRIELREMLFGTREAFTYLRCPGCGVLRIATVPADLGPYYPPSYYDGPPLPARPTVSKVAAIANRVRWETVLFGPGRRSARLLRRWASLPPPTVDERRQVRRLGLASFDDPVLDVGCGRRADQLVALRRMGFRKLTGIDPFLDADGEVEGVRLRKIGIGDVKGSFQTITFHHSFEHVPDPLVTLAAGKAVRLTVSRVVGGRNIVQVEYIVDGGTTAYVFTFTTTATRYAADAPTFAKMIDSLRLTA